MKTKFFIIAAIVGMVLVGCKKKIEEPGVLTMTTTVSGEYKLYITGTGTANIDWGDGSSDIVTLSYFPENFAEYYFKRTYASAGEKTITVTGNVLSLYTNISGKVTALDVSKMPALKLLWCSNEKLTSLDVSKNTALTELSCAANKLEDLDVSKNTALTYLNCGFNNLTKLDVSTNTALIELYCYYNNLNTLTLGTHNALGRLECFDNDLNKMALVDIFYKLPVRKPADDAWIWCGGFLYQNPGYWELTPAEKQIAMNKNWQIGDFY